MKDNCPFYKIISRINVYDKEKKLFFNHELRIKEKIKEMKKDKENDGLKEKEIELTKMFKPEQVYTLFVDVIFPEKLSINYTDFLHKMKNPKNLMEEEKVLKF